MKKPHIKPKSMQDEGDEEQIELKIHEQEGRLNVLLIITACIFFLNALVLGGKLFYDGVFSSKSKIVKPIVLSNVLEVGMPVTHIAIFGDVGYVKDFTLFGTRLNNKFPKLPHAQEGSEEGEHLSDTLPLYQIFAVHHIDHVYFLSCNPNSLVTKVNVDTRTGSTDQDNYQFNYETIPGSYIPNDHFRVRLESVQVGNYFWILGGFVYGFKNQIKTSIWVLNKEQWINGPEIPDINPDLPHFPSHFRSFALNSTNVLFVSYSHYIEYSFLSDTWTVREKSTKLDLNFVCQIIQDKDYSKNIVCIHGYPWKVIEVWNLETNQPVSLTPAFMLQPELGGNGFPEIVNFMHQANLISYLGELYLFDEYNVRTDNMSSVYKILPSALETLKRIEEPLFLQEFQNPEMNRLIKTYYDVTKSVTYLKRTYKTVKRVF